MGEQRILELADRLEGQGVDTSKLRPLQMELDVVERPGAIRRISVRARQLARQQWEHVVGEWKESREMMALVAQRARSRERMSPEEADRVRAQLADLLRMVPASLIVATNYTLPLPGTSFLTPMILRKLGLMPSRWREAHLLDQLSKEAERMRAEGQLGAAAAIEALEEQIASEADAREEAAREALLLTHWDANRNGRLDPHERQAYLDELARLREIAVAHAAKKRWYLLVDEHVVGPVRLSELGEVVDRGPLLVCYDAKSGWVELEALLLLDGG